MPLATPFRSGHVDLDALRTLADSYVAQGASGIVALGTTAEAALLTDSERDVVLKTVIETIARMPWPEIWPNSDSFAGNCATKPAIFSRNGASTTALQSRSALKAATGRTRPLPHPMK
ncbi:dihydrodipicolinate synthase family protein [Paraburkholderia strydomiana]|uniref:dihydrodipicolinate synthase family protein n=1 Tax=Paraburkholderia strydomiana TaxID=1245417 RepID=UPI0038BA0218